MWCSLYAHSTGQSSGSSKAKENLFIESIHQDVTKRKLDELRHFGFTVSQTGDRSGRVCSPCSNKARSSWGEFSFIKTSFQESEPNDERFWFKRMSASLMILRQG